jgi:hypothetical protein
VGILDALLPAVKQISDPIERSAVANDVAAYVGVERGVVLDRFRKTAAERQDRPLERPKIAMRADERLMLNALFDRGEMREEMIGELRSMDALGRMPARRIFQAVFALHDAGGALTFDAVHARLEEADQNLLADAVLREEVETSRDEVLAAMASIRRSGEQQRRDELKARIKESERAGDWNEALRLTGELQGLDRGARTAR